MTQLAALWLVVCGLGVLCLGLLAAFTTSRRAGQRELRLAHAEVGDLRNRLEELEVARASDPTPTPSPTSVPDARPDPGPDFVITRVGRHLPAEHAPIDPPRFADTVLRETVVKAASLAHGVRRGMAPATRNRIRFEMKQEVRRSRKQRRADLKTAQRELHARQRAAMSRPRSVAGEDA